MKKIETQPTCNLILWFCMLMLNSTYLYAQNMVINTTAGGGFSNNSGSGTVTFNFQNTNPYDIVITGIEGIVSQSVACRAEIWYKPTPLNGSPGAISVANGWILADSGGFTGIANTTTLTTQPFKTGMSFIVPAGATYAFAVSGHTSTLTAVQRYFVMSAGSPDVVFSVGGCNLITGDLVSFGGGVPPSSPANSPRGWLGKINFSPIKVGNHNAGLAAIPSAAGCSASRQVKVKLANTGINKIDSVQINYEINGVLQTPFTFLFPLDTIGSAGKTDTLLDITAINVTNSIQLVKVWTSMPNGNIDPVNTNDTVIYQIRQGLSGAYTIGGTGADFSGFNDAVNALRIHGKCGAVTFNVAAGSLFTERPVFISNMDSIVFQKSGTGSNPLVYGVNGNGATDAVFRIRGSNFITFDEIDVSDTISNPTNTERMEYGYAVVNASAVKGSSNNVIKNCRIRLQRVNVSTFGIIQSSVSTGGGVSATSLSGANHRNRIENVKITNAYKGIGLIGQPAFPDSNCIITSSASDTTIIGDMIPNDIGDGSSLVYGISVADQKNVEVSKCIVRNLNHTSTSTCQGIFVDNGSTTVDYGTARIFGNMVYNISRSTTTSATGTIHGIRIDVSTAAKALVYNNVVYNVLSNSTPTTASANVIVRGISHGTTAGTGTAEYYNNSVIINTPGLNSSSTSFWKGGSGMIVMKNNILSNTSPAQTGVSKHYAVFHNVANSVSESSNNLFWVQNGNGFLAFALIDRTTLPAYAAQVSPATVSDGNEQGSVFSNPNFAGATNLDFVSATPASFSGVTIPAVTTDINGTLRHASAPAIGAYETNQPQLDSSAPVIRNVQITNGLTPVIKATLTDNSSASAAGDIRLWYRSQGSNTAFLSIFPDSVPQSSISGIYQWKNSLGSLSSGSYEFYIAARDMAGVGLNISVNPVQTFLLTTFSVFDPVNYSLNPPVAGSINVRNFIKQDTIQPGLYTVGATGNFSKITQVANFLRSSVLLGNVIFELQPSYDGTTGETFPIVFDQFNTLGGNHTVIIRPAASASGLSLIGNNNTSLIDLNGVKNLTITGKAGGLGSSVFTVNNASTLGAAIRFLNSAQNNALIGLNIVGNTASLTSGVIAFLTASGTSASDGNNGNVVDSCSVNGNLNARNGIYSSGSIAPADNKNNTIINNNIFDFFTNVSGETANAILLEGGNSSWAIGTLNNGNRIYQTGPRNTTSTPSLSAPVNFKGININSPNGGGFSVNGNRIGGNIPGIASSDFTIGDAVSTFNHTVRLIEVNVNNLTPTIISNNLINNIGVYSGVANYFAGLFCSGGRINAINNMIGSDTGTGAIFLRNNGTVALANAYGIRYASCGGIMSQNKIGSFQINQSNASGSSQFIGLYASGTSADSLLIINNLVGSLTTPGNIIINGSSLGGVNLMGFATSSFLGAPCLITGNMICNLVVNNTVTSVNNTLKGGLITGSSNAPIMVDGNTVRNLYTISANTNSNENMGLAGIVNLTSGNGAQLISNNVVFNLISARNISSPVSVSGIYFGSSSTASVHTITRNRIFNLYGDTINDQVGIDGIALAGSGSSRTLVANNMVSLGSDSAGAFFRGAAAIKGISKTNGIASVYHNTVFIHGSGVRSNIVNTFGFNRTFSAADSVVNNIFINNRSNFTNGGNHHAIGLNNLTGLIINANNYATANPNLGLINSVNQSNLTDWRLATNQDVKSVSVMPFFVSNTDLHLTGLSIGNTQLSCSRVALVADDIDSEPRNIFAYMGADEIPGFPLPVSLLTFEASLLGEDVLVYWSVSEEKNLSGYDVEYSLDGLHFKSLTYVKSVNAQSSSRYSVTHHNPMFNSKYIYYRLRMRESDGKENLSKVVFVIIHGEQNKDELSCWPNPFVSNIQLSVNASGNTNGEMRIADITGKIVHISTHKLLPGNNLIEISGLDYLKPGMYYLTLSNEGVFYFKKILK